MTFLQERIYRTHIPAHFPRYVENGDGGGKLRGGGELNRGKLGEGGGFSIYSLSFIFRLKEPLQAIREKHPTIEICSIVHRSQLALVRKISHSSENGTGEGGNATEQ